MACRVAANSRLTGFELSVVDVKEACCGLPPVAQVSDSSIHRCGEVGFLGNGASVLMLQSYTVSEVRQQCIVLSEESTGLLTYCTLARSMAGL